MTPIAGFEPDLDNTKPGVLVDCSNLMPTPKGYKAAPSAVSVGLPALADACRGAAVVRKSDNTKRIFAGTDLEMYEQSGSTWNNVSRVGGYTTSAEARWRFTQFGDATLAVNQVDPLQVSITGDFSDVAGSPEARCIETSSGFVMLAGTNEGTYGDQPDRWWCSGVFDYTDWTPSVTTQCTTGRLVDSPGDIRAIKRLGNNIIAYKERSIYLGSYAGPPVVWAWQLIPGEIGTPSAESVVNIGSAHIFVGFEDIYLFDGSRPQPIGAAIKEWFFRQVNPIYRHKIIGAYDRARSMVCFYYPSISGGGAIDSCLLYHWPTGKWGRADRTIEAAVEYTSAGLTFDSIGTAYTTWDSLPNIAFDSPFWTTESLVPAVIDDTHTLVQLSGVAGTSSLTTGDAGDTDAFTTVTRITPKFLEAPTSATLQNQYRNVLGDPLINDATVTLTNGRFDFIRSARWHRVRIETVGDMEITAMNINSTTSGEF